MVAWTDEMMLRVLDATERQGQSAAEIGRAMGCSRSAVLGLLKRLRDDLAASEAAPFAPGQGPAVRPGNRDGDLGPLWWKRAARRGRA